MVWKRKLKLFVSYLVKLPFLLIAIVPAFFMVLTVRLMRSVFLIRFHKLISWRIGHFAGNTEMYLCELDAGINKPEIRFLDFWYYPCKPCNQQLAKMWNRVLHIGPAILFGLVDRINTMIPGGDIHRIGDNTLRDRDVHNLLDRFPPHLSFLTNEVKMGEAGLRALGIPEGASFVCLAVRDSSYLSEQSPHLDWSRHNFRDCNIQNYVLAATKLVELGYYVVRMGVVVKEAMNVDHPMIIDYAGKGLHSDFMDIYLGANCKFFISNGSGIDAVPYIFRQPIVYVDLVPLGIISTYSSKSISSTKKYWLRDQSRFMTLQEIFESGAGYYVFSTNYEAMGIDLIESTPEEIADIVLEMESRLNGTWKSSDDDEELQQRFWDLFPKTDYHGEIRSRIGSEFLRRHRDYLDESREDR